MVIIARAEMVRAAKFVFDFFESKGDMVRASQFVFFLPVARVGKSRTAEFVILLFGAYLTELISP